MSFEEGYESTLDQCAFDQMIQTDGPGLSVQAPGIFTAIGVVDELKCG